jgi:hypothetical protein
LRVSSQPGAGASGHSAAGGSALAAVLEDEGSDEVVGVTAEPVQASAAAASRKHHSRRARLRLTLATSTRVYTGKVAEMGEALTDPDQESRRSRRPVLSQVVKYSMKPEPERLRSLPDVTQAVVDNNLLDRRQVRSQCELLTVDTLQNLERVIVRLQ